MDIIFTEDLSAHSICPDCQPFIRIDPFDESPDRGDVFLIQRIITDLYRCFHDDMVAADKIKNIESTFYFKVKG
jgi:hypothetical protein